MKSYEWLDEDDDELTSPDTFTMGEEYTLWMELEVVDPTPVNFADSITFILNNVEISSGVYEYERDDNGACEIKITFKATPPTRVIRVTKEDEHESPLEGATISITGTSISGEEKNYELVSDYNGLAEFTVEYGNYTISEKEAPYGYMKTDEEFIIIVDEIGILDENEEEITDEFTFVNIKRTPILVHKTDTGGKPLEGAVIRLSPETSAPDDYTQYKEETTGPDGTVIFYVEDILSEFQRSSEFILSEASAPSGYRKTDETYHITIESWGVFFPPEGTNENPAPYDPVTFINTKIASDRPSSKPSGEPPALIKDDHFAYMVGYPGGIFGPEKNISRAEAVVMFSRLLVKSMELDKDYKDNYYSDVNEKAWYANQVAYMRELGVLKDYTKDEYFRPDEPVTRAEFATLAAQFDKLSPVNTNSFTDVADNHWAVSYINSAANKGWINGYPDKTFKPEGFITRAEVVTLVNRILERSADRDYLAAADKTIPLSYKDVQTDHWAYLDIMEASIAHDFIKDGKKEKWQKIYE